MRVPDGKWRVSFYMNEMCELLTATVEVKDPEGRREIVRMITGPFDSPDEILEGIIELIDHAEWHGDQLRLPVAADKE